MEVKELPLSLVHPSPMNPRKTFDEEGIKELAGNIREQGLLQPITVRPIAKTPMEEGMDADQEYEIVCGERRYRAMSLLDQESDTADFATISAIVREMTDAEAYDAMITENLQRKDVDPIEEAFAFGKLIEMGNTAEDVALRFGKSIRFVTDRIKLNALVPELMVEVKDNKLPISAAMLISKLDHEQQREYAKRERGNYSKFSAERFVNNLFMFITQSTWFNDEPDFAGETCGKSCRECEFNTANHGCLFYEMNANERTAKCTNRDRFNAKIVDYAFHVIEKYSDRLVNADEPLEKGKMVIGIDIPSYLLDKDKSRMRDIETQVRANGYEVVNSGEYFRSRVGYDVEDERTQQLLENGAAYLVLDMFSYTSLNPTVRAYYVRKDDESTNCTATGIPSKVVELMNEYKRENVPANYTVALSQSIGNNAEPTINALSETERIAICAAILRGNHLQMLKLGLNIAADDDVLSYVKDNIATCFNSVLRGYLINELKSGRNEIMHMLRDMLPELGQMWCDDECDKAMKDTDAKKRKKLAKLTKQLADLGYTPDGRKLIKETKPTMEQMLAQYEQMKQKHNDAMLLFRVGDFYELYEQDANTAAVTLGLTLTTREGKSLCAFPHTSLDTYLPEIVRAGYRVAICEQKEQPK